MSRPFEKRDVSSAKLLHTDITSSFIYIKNKRGGNTDTYGTSELIFLHTDV